jgi:hypothetical protein
MLSTYLIIGLIWIAILDFVVKVRIEEEPMNNFSRFMNFALWPLTLIIFIGGAIYGYFNHGKDEE